ncbi:extracellular solute-binding protein [Nakamurella sp. YIM 132087]|uniref:Extracellular solute-binding protein n=1 Tax=Nakamurella alba TaxID=2665158 RepID=A0A7K1FM36_9ACTN|nr:extracellular solute-binding protein [Nakamurella alba]MTD15215.1 extracellular solute-binding protein [Nakamurella alba]
MSTINRRAFLTGAAALASAPLLAACGGDISTGTTTTAAGSTAGSTPASPGSSAGSATGSATAGSSSGGGTKEKITIFAFLGNRLADMPKAFAQDYMSRHSNVEIEIYEDSNANGYPKILAAKQADPTATPLVNMGFFNSQISAQGDLDGTWNKLDYAALSNAADISDTFRRPNMNGIGVGADQIGLLYNTDAVSTPPTSWTALWEDEQFAGRLSLWDYWWYVVFMAAKVNGGDLSNMDAGWDIWRENAPNVRTIVTANPEWQQVMSNGTSDLTSCWNGTGLQFKADGAPVDYVVPTEGAIAVPVYLQTLAGNSDNQQEICLDILNEMLSPQWDQMWAETAVQTPANSTVELPADLKDLPGFLPENVDKLISIDWGLVAANNADWRARWDADIKANI